MFENFPQNRATVHVLACLFVFTAIGIRGADAGSPSQCPNIQRPNMQRPNILFIYTDDHSYRTVGCYPQAFPWVCTPNIDRLAREGMRFESAYIGT